MAAIKPGGKLTCRDYFSMPDDGKRYELIGGELYEMPPPTTEHQSIVGNLYLLLRAETDKSGGKVLLSPVGVVLEDDRVVEPDLLVLTSERLHLDKGHAVVGGPDLAVEVASPSTTERDQTVKRDLYARAGVREYWRALPGARSIEVLVLSDGKYCVHCHASGNEPVTSTVLPNLSFPASAAFT